MESNTELKTINEDSLSVELSSINLRDPNFSYDPTTIEELLLNKFDNKKKYQSVVPIIQSQDQNLKSQIASGIDEAEKNKIAILPIYLDGSWVSVTLWQEDDVIQALHNDPRGNPVNTSLQNYLLSFGVDLIDLEFPQQISPADSGVFIVDNLIKTADFVLNHEGYVTHIPREKLPTNIELMSARIIGDTISGQERIASEDVNAISAQLRHRHNNVLNEIEEDKIRKLSTNFRPIFDHRSNNLYIAPESRPPSPFGKNQGEHVTNWSLYKKAVKKIIEANSNDLENCKNELILLVGSLALEENRDKDNEFLNHINDIVRDYNSRGRTSHQAVENKEQRDAINREAQDKALAEMARITLSTINRLSDITHPEEGNIKAGLDNSNAILNRLDKEQKGEVVYGRSSSVFNLVQDVFDLMHYPYIPEDSLRSVGDVGNIRYAGRSNSLKYTKRDLKTRTNSLDTLADVMARHLNAVTAAYPELMNVDIIQEVIQKKSDQWLSAAQHDGKQSADYLNHFRSKEGEVSKFYESVTRKMQYRREEFSPTKPAKAVYITSDRSGSRTSGSSKEDDNLLSDLIFVGSAVDEDDLMIKNEIIIAQLRQMAQDYELIGADNSTPLIELRTGINQVIDHCTEVSKDNRKEINQR